MELFEQPASAPGPTPPGPLADRMRPRSLDEVVGQEHLLGPGRVLRTALERGELHSMILWGPPGSGKTTLASLMARVAGARFVAFSAVLSGVKEIRQVVAEADVERTRRRVPTILFVDEIHRFNRAQQDGFLPYVEQGVVTLVGATRSIAPGRSVIDSGASSTSNTRSKLTIAVIRSTRAFVRPVSGW